jgi:glycosyltransferase involved in cell wall biosynthesis
MRSTLPEPAPGASRHAAGAAVAVVGFEAHGHLPLHLRALLASGRPFLFIGARSLWARAAAELPAATASRRAHLWEETEHDTPESELERVEQILAQEPAVTAVVFLHFNRYPRQLPALAWRRRWRAIGRCRVSGVLAAPMAFSNRSTRNDWREFGKWCAWLIAVGGAPRGPRVRLMSMSGDRVVPRVVRWLVRGRVRGCPEPYDRQSIPDTLERAADAPPAVLFFGFLHPRKGTVWALQALERWSEPLRVLVAGESPEAAEITRTAARLGPAVAAELHLVRSDDRTKEEYYKRASVVAMPYLGYCGSSGVLFEAMLYRRRAVLSDICAVPPELVASGAVQVFATGDAEAFRRALAAALTAEVDWGRVDAFLRQHGVEAYVAALLPPVALNGGARSEAEPKR